MIRAGAGNDRLYGGEGDDKLFGQAGNDRIIANEGNDVLNGGARNDRMTGGEGADLFVFNGGRDIVTDFENGDDRIDVSFYSHFDSYADIRNAAKQSDNDVVIQAGNDYLVIEDTRLGELSRDDFIW